MGPYFDVRARAARDGAAGGATVLPSILLVGFLVATRNMGQEALARGVAGRRGTETKICRARR